MAATVASEVLSNTAGITEKITTPNASDPKFAIFGGAAVVSKTKNITQVTSNEAGITGYYGYSGPYDPKFSVF